MWVKVDDRFPEHRKVVEAGRHLGSYGQGRVVAVWLVGMTYCNRNLTDGLVDEATIKTWTLFDRRPLDVAKVMALRMPNGDAGLLEERDAGRFYFHDYDLYQPAAQEVQAKLDWESRRKKLYAIPGLVDAVRARDQNACRYCAALVNWKDRRGARGGTYDLIDPRGQTALDNIVVACHGCNAIKGGRLLEESGLTLLPPPPGPSGNGPGSGRDSELGKTQVRPSSELVGDLRVPDPIPVLGKKDHGAVRRPQMPEENDRVLKALVWRQTHAVFAAATDEFSLPHLTELLKCTAARAGLRYDSDFFHRQVEVAFVRVPLQHRPHRRSAA